jgi:antitoxin component of MazEF toxin-antitoxin module
MNSQEITYIQPPSVTNIKAIVKLRKQGNSAMATIPKELLTDLGWKIGDKLLLDTKKINDHKTLSADKVE